METLSLQEIIALLEAGDDEPHGAGNVRSEVHTGDLIRVLQADTSPSVLIAVCDILGPRAPEEAAPALIGLVNHPTAIVRAAAAATLCWIGVESGGEEFLH